MNDLIRIYKNSTLDSHIYERTSTNYAARDSNAGGLAHVVIRMSEVLKKHMQKKTNHEQRAWTEGIKIHANLHEKHCCPLTNVQQI